ncbi:MAG: TonB-dependent receptor [Pseudomonadota bacterium]
MTTAPNRKTLLFIQLAALLSTGTAAAQNTTTLEEVIVTAQKRTESLQDVPISVATLNEETLELRNINDLKDIGTAIPNLYINPFNNDPTAIRLFIRGVGQNDIQITQDPSVALYTDGVYVGTSFGTGFEGVDIERIEVLRGPQGTLYGRNATGGAVNIITQRANTESLEFRQDLTFGDFSKFQTRTILNVPFLERFAGKISYVKSERDGYVDNKGPGEDFGQEDRDTLVVDLRWEATDRINVDYRYENAKNEDTQRLEQVRALDPTAFLAPFTTFNDDVSEDFLDEVTSLRPIVKNDQTVEGHGLWVEWEIGEFMTFRSITAYRELDSFTSGDALSTATGDYTAIGRGVGAPNIGRFQTDYEQTSQELQLLGNTEHWKWVAGLYYFEDDGSQDATTTESLGVTDQEDFTKIKNESIAAYAEATWNPDIMDARWHFTLGARYSEDERKADRINLRATTPFSGSYSKDFDNFNPSATIAFDINEDMNVYGKVVSGYKSGGTSTRSANAELFASGFDEEDVLSYELGYKGEFWDSRARLNAAVFYMEIDGLQTSVQTDPVSPGGRDFLPVDGNEISGVELDLTLLLTTGLTFTASYGYLDTELGEDSVDSPAGTFVLIDEFAPAPENSYALSLDYQRGLTNGDLIASVDYGWQDKSFTSVNLADATEIDSYGLLGAALGWSNIEVGGLPGSFRALLWGRNLTDEEYGLVSTNAWATFGALDVQTFGDPRTYGVTLSYQY